MFTNYTEYTSHSWTDRPMLAATRSMGIMIAGFLVTACADTPGPTPPDDPAVLETTVAGLVWRNAPVPETLVIVRDDSGVITRQQTDAHGRFDIGLGAVRGMVELTADGLRQRVEVTTVGDTVEGVLLSPVGTLAEAYVDAAVAPSRADALNVVAAFFQIPLTGEDLVTLDEQRGASCGDLDDVTVGPSVLSGLFQGGLRYLGEALIDGASGSARPDDIVDVLATDLAADGFLDGIGPGGQALSFAGTDIDALVMRARYVNALTGFLRSSRNQSGFGPDCFKRFFDEILLSRSPLFPESTWIDTPFETGCARCIQLANGDFSCTSDGCGACGRCDIDFSGANPVAQCVANETLCNGDCNRCAPTAEDADIFQCVAAPDRCGGNCGVCRNNGLGGFSCQADTDACTGNCAQCVAGTSTSPSFSCAAAPDVCLGDCAVCAGGETSFRCQGDLSRCRGPSNGTQCNRCLEVAEVRFLCTDVDELCPADSESTGDCEHPFNVCSLTGTETLTRSDWRCQQGACVEQVVVSERACVRNADDVACGQSQCDPWPFTCTQQGNNACALTGVQHRNCVRFRCDRGSCSENVPYRESRSCPRNTDGQTCDVQPCGPLGEGRTESLCCQAGACTNVCSSCR